MKDFIEELYLNNKNIDDEVNETPISPVHCQAFHELAMDYRGADPINVCIAYDALCLYIEKLVIEGVYRFEKEGE